MSDAPPGRRATISVQMPDAVLELRPELLERADAFHISVHPGDLVIKLLMLADEAAEMIFHCHAFPTVSPFARLILHAPVDISNRMKSNHSIDIVYIMKGLRHAYIASV